MVVSRPLPAGGRELLDEVHEYLPEDRVGLIERALTFAIEAHGEQKRRSGDPYITHPIAVARLVTSLRMDPPTIAAALLHDVVEDTAVTFADLQAAGFSDEIVDTVRALTKSPGERRLDAATRAASHPIARVVKLADVRDNMDLSRIAEPTPQDYARISEYAEVRALLESRIANATLPPT